MKRMFFLATTAMLTTSVLAADLGDPYPGQCRLVGPSALLSIADDAKLSSEVVKLMTEAVNVADDNRYVASTRHAFTWASEAKVACGKAFGYLQTNFRDEEYLNKCECFHSRMRQYMN